MYRTKRQKQLGYNIGEVLAAAPEGTRWGVAVLEARTLNVIAGRNTRMLTEALSLSKLALTHVVKHAINKGGLTPGQRLPIETRDVRDGGFLGHLLPGDATLEDVTQAMLRVSDTTGQRAITRIFRGPKKVNQSLIRVPVHLEQGKPHPLYITRLERVGLLPGETEATARFRTGMINPFEAALCYSAATQYPPARQAMQTNIFGSGLRRDLPNDTAPPAAFLEALARTQNGNAQAGDLEQLLHPSWPESPYPNMMGIGEGSRHDVAQIGGSIMAALSEGYDPALPEDASHPAHDIHAELGKLIFAYEEGK